MSLNARIFYSDNGDVVFLAVDRHSHSVSDTLYGIFPYVVPCLMLVNWVASKTVAAARKH